MDACVSGKLPEMELKLIFARLPLKDIVRLQALNTHWKFLIRSSFFQQHMEQAISQGGARFGLLTQVISKDLVPFVGTSTSLMLQLVNGITSHSQDHQTQSQQAFSPLQQLED
jgi:hypothetical protein